MDLPDTHQLVEGAATCAHIQGFHSLDPDRALLWETSLPDVSELSLRDFALRSSDDL